MSDWIAKSIPDVARFFGVSDTTVRKSWRPRGMPGKPGKWPLDEIARWRHLRDTQDQAQQSSPGADAGDDDPMLAAGSSPALERYRDERARIARLDRLEREGELIERDKMHEFLARAAHIVRGAGETLQRDHGREAQSILDEAIDDMEREIEDFFGGDRQLYDEEDQEAGEG